MAMTGVTVHEDCTAQFALLKQNKSDSMAMAFKINDEEKIVPAETTPKGTSYADWRAAVPAKESRYYVLDFSFEVDGVTKTKMFFIMWNPDTNTVQKKMKYAGSRKALEAAFDNCGGLISHNANDKDDLDEKEMFNKAKRGF
eukprot:TRINITY_DN305_c0_g1_i3.p1 TRINITY_DN305_c0_g1~~TRINITY_DN305_c0_g1_i3.p1  ORF type:complete len:142 (+),score=85.02 TRINITY_DN305_c0_g1_i3:61-486(+)